MMKVGELIIENVSETQQYTHVVRRVMKIKIATSDKVISETYIF